MDQDIRNARQLAEVLTKTADALESREHPEHDESRHALIRRVVDAWHGLTHSNADKRLNLRRARIMEDCQRAAACYAKRLHLVDVPSGAEIVEDNPMPLEWRLERATDMASMFIVMDLPDLETGVQANRAKLTGYLRALLTNTGGPGNVAEQYSDDAYQLLIDALGLGGVDAESVRRSMRRTRAT